MASGGGISRPRAGAAVGGRLPGRLRSIPLARALGLLALAGLVGLAGISVWSQQQSVEALRAANAERLHWSASRLEQDLARFTGALAAHGLAEGGGTGAEVRLRHDILWSRALLFSRGTVGAGLAGYDREGRAISRLLALIERERAAVRALAAGEHARAGPLLERFRALAPALADLSRAVFAGEERRRALMRARIREAGRISTLISAGALALATLLFAVMAMETRRYRRLAAESEGSARRAAAANAAKARFLTMMNHELRTPLNGVLGVLALLRQTPLSEPQGRLVDQARRSGEAMTALVSDLQDFTDLQAGALSLERAPFAPHGLAARLRRELGPVLSREGAALEVAPDPGLPGRLAGDEARIAQAARAFAVFLVEKAGARALRLALAHGGGRLALTLEAEAPGNGPVWQPESVYGLDPAGAGDVASDSLGPMIARGLVTLMGGSLRVTRPDPGRARLEIRLPARPVEGVAPLARIEAGSRTVAAMAEGTLAELGWGIWRGGDGARVAAVLVEAGDPEAPDRIATLRTAHPNARVVALGSPPAPGADAACPSPPTAPTLAAALGGREAGLSSVS